MQFVFMRMPAVDVSSPAFDGMQPFCMQLHGSTAYSSIYNCMSTAARGFIHALNPIQANGHRRVGCLPMPMQRLGFCNQRTHLGLASESKKHDCT